MIWVWPALGVALLVGVALWLRRRGPTLDTAEACRRFHQQREHLEAAFFEAAAATGKPRGLRWVECDWDDPVEFARDRNNGLLTALFSVTIRFEAIPGSDMEGLPAVGNLRNATAVFYFAGGRWQTAGRTVFNLNPDEVLARFGKQFERVELETGERGASSTP